jgi:Leucine-rich repeat (LRR) protein
VLESPSNPLARVYFLQLPNLEKLVLYSNDINFSFEGIEKAAKLKVLVLDSTGLTSLRGVGNAKGLEVRFAMVDVKKQ